MVISNEFCLQSSSNYELLTDSSSQSFLAFNFEKTTPSEKIQFLAEESAMIIYLVEFLPIHFFFFTLEKSSCYLHYVVLQFLTLFYPNFILISS